MDESTATISLLPYLFRILTAFFVILAIGCLAIFLLKKFQTGRGIQGSWVKVLGKGHLNARNFVYVVQVAKKVMVLGVSDSRISSLAELSPYDVPTPPPKADATANETFLDKLKRTMSQNEPEK